MSSPCSSIRCQGSALYTLRDGRWVAKHTRAAEQVFSASSFSSKNQAILVAGGSARDSLGVPTGVMVRADFWLDESTGFRRLPDAAELLPRRSSAAARVASSGEIVIFGGVNTTEEPVTLTRIWDGGRWRVPEQPEPAPLVARSRHAMASLGADAIVLFGGLSSTEMLGDTWIWRADTETWSADERPGPPPRINGTLATLGDEVVLYGGDLGRSDRLMEDTWLYRLDTGWTQKTDGQAPPARTHAMATTALDGTSTLLFGGAFTSGVIGELWEFRGGAWSMLGDLTPLRRRRGGIAADRRLGRLYVAGGTGSNTESDVWDLTERQPRPVGVLVLEDNQELPLRRHEGIFVENARTGGVLMASGQSNDERRLLGDTWQLTSYGAACTQSSECSEGQFCTDGVCCEAASCGPCRTCASPARPGLCAPRAVFGPEPGCDLPGQACNERGSCRLDNDQACNDDRACASGTCLRAGRDAGVCCAAEGCLLRCIGGDLRGPDGNNTSCAPYGCTVDHCNTVCRSIEDCAEGFVCDGNGACVPLGDEASRDEGCSCRVVTGGGNSWAGVAAGLTLLAARVRRRRR